MKFYTITTVTVPTTTYNYVRQTRGGDWHIAGNGRKPLAKTTCGLKRVAQYEGDLPMWADCLNAIPAAICQTCEVQS